MNRNDLRLNFHPEKITDLISFYPKAKVRQCRCKHRDPVVISHPASGLQFQLCKSCADRIGVANYIHKGGIRRSVPIRANVHDLKFASRHDGVPWPPSPPEPIGTAEAEAASVMRDIRYRYWKTRIVFFSIVGLTILAIVLFGG